MLFTLKKGMVKNFAIIKVFEYIRFWSDRVLGGVEPVKEKSGHYFQNKSKMKPVSADAFKIEQWPLLNENQKSSYVDCN